MINSENERMLFKVLGRSGRYDQTGFNFVSAPFLIMYDFERYSSSLVVWFSSYFRNT